MKRSHQVIAALASAAALTLGASALSQPADGPGAGRRPAQGMGYGPGMDGGHGPMGHWHGKDGMEGRGPMGGHNPAAMVEAHLAYLKTDLKITAAQESAWNAFAAKSRNQAEGMHAMHDKMREGAATGTAPERLARAAEAMRQRAAGMEGMSAALKDLYAALSPEQVTVAEKDFARHRGAGAWHRAHR
jgi:hypothetical protein